MSGLAIGLLLVLALATATGGGVLLAGEMRHRQRTRLDALSWRLWRWEQEILASADSRGCPCCHLLRHRSELLRSPSSESWGLD